MYAQGTDGQVVEELKGSAKYGDQEIWSRTGKVVGNQITLPPFFNKMSKIVYKTLDEIKQEAIDRLNDPNAHPARITRAYESLFGASINHSVGDQAPEGKFKVVITEGINN